MNVLNGNTPNQKCPGCGIHIQGWDASKLEKHFSICKRFHRRQNLSQLVGAALDDSKTTRHMTPTNAIDSNLKSRKESPPRKKSTPNQSMPVPVAAFPVLTNNQKSTNPSRARTKLPASAVPASHVRSSPSVPHFSPINLDNVNKNYSTARTNVDAVPSPLTSPTAIKLQRARKPKVSNVAPVTSPTPSAIAPTSPTAVKLQRARKPKVSNVAPATATSATSPTPSAIAPTMPRLAPQPKEHARISRRRRKSVEAEALKQLSAGLTEETPISIPATTTATTTLTAPEKRSSVSMEVQPEKILQVPASSYHEKQVEVLLGQTMISSSQSSVNDVCMAEPVLKVQENEYQPYPVTISSQSNMNPTSMSLKQTPDITAQILDVQFIRKWIDTWQQPAEWDVSLQQLERLHPDCIQFTEQGQITPNADYKIGTYWFTLHPNELDATLRIQTIPLEELSK